jgi:hypothetical protein
MVRVAPWISKVRYSYSLRAVTTCRNAPALLVSTA